MSAAAAMMMALLIHLGSAGLDSSSRAEVMYYRETLPAGHWLAEHSPGRDAWSLTSTGRLDGGAAIHIQRVSPSDPVYALVLSDAVGIVSLGAVREHLRAASREGSGVLPADLVLVGWDEAARDGNDRDGNDRAEAPRVSPPPEDSPGNGDQLHFRWAPGEVAVSMPQRAELFILRYR
ncbi:MAG: hypothetical protein EA427_01630 [Spirochaetaceae bacterium]|nr:MAG: hypothetical protein EA427_01630 [Spirochaetaceae bacterium]